MSRELTRQEKAAIRKLVTKWCANYDKDYGCLPLDCPCYMLGKCWTGAYCRYFRAAVLPLDPVLERSLTVERITETRPCPVCGRAFLPDGRQRYCSPVLRRSCPAGAEAGVYAPQTEVARGKIAPENACIYKAFPGRFRGGRYVFRPPLFLQKCFPHPSAGALGHFVPKSRLKGEILPKYYEISEAAAKRAKDMNSYSDYAPGSATAGYQQMVDEAYALAEKQKAQVDPMYHDKIDALVDRYARRLAENLNERNAIDARVPSILITGDGNFPVAKKGQAERHPCRRKAGLPAPGGRQKPLSALALCETGGERCITVRRVYGQKPRL